METFMTTLETVYINFTCPLKFGFSFYIFFTFLKWQLDFYILCWQIASMTTTEFSPPPGWIYKFFTNDVVIYYTKIKWMS